MPWGGMIYNECFKSTKPSKIYVNEEISCEIGGIKMTISCKSKTCSLNLVRDVVTDPGELFVSTKIQIGFENLNLERKL